MMIRKPLRTGGGIKTGGCGATIHSERTPKISRSVSVSKNNRSETRTDISPSEPATEPESARASRVQPGKGAQRPAKRLWKRRSLRELGNPFGIPTFPQPQQQQAVSGYISNGATWIARVTFSNGLTRTPVRFLARRTIARVFAVVAMKVFSWHRGRPVPRGRGQPGMA